MDLVVPNRVLILFDKGANMDFMNENDDNDNSLHGHEENHSEELRKMRKKMVKTQCHISQFFLISHLTILAHNMFVVELRLIFVVWYGPA
jgi:hypothetical protein